jgi:ferredoxin-type protein NapG
LNRRDFFKKSLKKVIQSASELAGSALEIVNPPAVPEEELGFLAKSGAQPSLSKYPAQWKLPPGSISEWDQFIQLCTGCGECSLACPYNVIQPVFHEESSKNIPFLDLNHSPCRVCDDVPCANACKTGAILREENFPKLGMAEFIPSFCINTKSGEKTCQACELACPIPETILFNNNQPQIEDTCVGCGQCVQVCPTFPRAIRIN